MIPQLIVLAIDLCLWLQDIDLWGYKPYLCENDRIETYWEPIGKAYKYRTLLHSGDVVEAQHFNLKLAVSEIMP